MHRLSPRPFYLLSAVAGLLLVPLIATQFTDAVNWAVGDFVVMGLLLTGVLTALDFTVRSIKRPRNRWLIGLSVLALFLLVWAELAVGLFGTPFAGS